MYANLAWAGVILYSNIVHMHVVEVHVCILTSEGQKLPVSMIRMPTMRVLSSKVTSTVASTTCFSWPADEQMPTTEEAMADRNMSPTSWTCPTAKGSVDLQLKAN